MPPVTPSWAKSALSVLSPIRPAAMPMRSGLGTLNETLRGGTQPAAQLLKQLQGKPNVKRGALDAALGHVDPARRLSPQELSAEVRSPKLFAQRSQMNRLDDESVMELANDLVFGPHFVERRAEIVHELLEEIVPQTLTDAQRSQRVVLLNILSGDDPATVDAATRFLDQAAGHDMQGIFQDELYEDAFAMAREQLGNSKRLGPEYAGYQRQQVPSELNRYAGAEDTYFETVLRGTPGRARSFAFPDRSDGSSSYHFSNPAQLGHVRGTTIDPAAMDGRKVVALDEVQSDPLEVLGEKHPAMQGVYGQLGRMALDRSAASGADSLWIPDAKRIASVRSMKQLPFFQDVYDKQLGKEFYGPMAERGVPVQYDNGWYQLSIDDAVRDAIQHKGLLNYKRGGLARGC